MNFCCKMNRIILENENLWNCAWDSRSKTNTAARWRVCPTQSRQTPRYKGIRQNLQTVFCIGSRQAAQTLHKALGRLQWLRSPPWPGTQWVRKTHGSDSSWEKLGEDTQQSCHCCALLDGPSRTFIFILCILCWLRRPGREMKYCISASTHSEETNSTN